MNKFSAFMMILIGLFTFQSIWSVAEAACLHEMPNVIDRSVWLASAAQSSPSENVQQQHPSALEAESFKISDYCQKICFNEKCNHFTNHFALDLDQGTQDEFNRNSFVSLQPSFFWLNFYQSPDLTSLSPPPELTPL